ncbi:type IV pilus assembly protein FimV [Acinetobacter venetianus]|uniref:type IV pilus assembly protein FimV n=1 Tax=Acinetobacter venetianus TaxID=52133 RepID=UPI00214F6F15|nr:FimV domain-containing protein [Acinetobacter venetianus]MCR4531791.1 FimV domain-containing protein [Acinetobacter venetianus]
MTVYNKLKIAILTILSSQHLYAITLDPLQIQSAPGELLYAEMSFHQADPNAKLEVSLATPEDLVMIGAAHQPPSALNFFTRRNNRGEGVIVITSSRPMTDAELNIIIKIQEDGASHLKHIRQPIRSNIQKVQAATVSNEKTLTPKFIVSEKDIALDLPESTRFNTASIPKEPTLKQEKLLNAPYELPPALNVAKSKLSVATSISTVTPTAEQNSNVVVTKDAQPTPNTLTATEQKSATPSIRTETKESADVKTLSATQPTTNTTSTSTSTSTIKQENQPAVVAQNVNESLLGKNQDQDSPEKLIENKEDTIAAYRAKNKEQPVKQKAPQNTIPSVSGENTLQQHVVARNESLWSIAHRIASQTHKPVSQVMNQIKAQNEHAFIGGNANRLRQGSQLNFNLGNIPSRQNQNVNQIVAQTPQPASGKTKYRLQQAEMSLVAESNQDSSTGSAKKDTLQQKTSTDLSLKVMTAREKTVTLQRNVTQLELALRQKEQRIQLLNARLAELQERLKAQQETKKPTH